MGIFKSSSPDLTVVAPCEKSGGQQKKAVDDRGCRTNKGYHGEYEKDDGVLNCALKLTISGLIKVNEGRLVYLIIISR